MPKQRALYLPLYREMFLDSEVGNALALAFRRTSLGIKLDTLDITGVKSGFSI